MPSMNQQILKRAPIARFADASSDFRFATAVMGAAEIFRRSPTAAEWKLVRQIASGATRPGDAERTEFLSLLEQAKTLGARVANR